MESGSDITQTRITNYIPVLNEVQLLLQNNQKLRDLIVQNSASNAVESSLKTGQERSVLENILSNITRNMGKIPTQRRHGSNVKKFATSLYIFSGSTAYEFLQQNLPHALPSLKTVQNIVNSCYSHIEEGQFQFEKIKLHLDKHRLPKIVTIAEDATRIVKRIEYDPRTNKCVGFVLPIGKKGFVRDTYKATSFE